MIINSSLLKLPTTFVIYSAFKFSSISRTMSTAPPSFLQVLATSVSATNKAGDLIRDILHKGNLEIVEKTGADDLQVMF